jgi:mono/diheme cytochrome c family protein
MLAALPGRVPSRTDDRKACGPRRILRVVFPLLLLVASVLATPTLADDRTADTQRLLELLTGVRLAYLEAFEDRGAELESHTDLEEARLRFAEVRQLNDRLHLLPDEKVSALATDLDAEVGRFDVPDRVEALVATVTKATGVTLVTLPPAPPSAVRGGQLFGENCAGCHGPRGAGDGPDARRGEMTPADFTSVVFMRREIPLDFFHMIGLGHRRRGMPEWSQSLSTQQRWDLVAWIWGLQHPDPDRVAGARVWRDRCAGCHGSDGAGVAGKAADLSRPGSLIERSDRVVFVRLSGSSHAEAFAGLTDAERWQVVGHVRAISLGGAGTPSELRRP